MSVLQTEFHLVLNEAERTELLGLLEQSFQDTRVERRRTDSFAFQQEVQHEEDVIRGLLAKVRQLVT